MSLKKVYSPFLSVIYGIYNFFAISLLITLFLLQKAWDPKGSVRKIRKSL